MDANKIFVVLLAVLSWGTCPGLLRAEENELADQQQQVAERYRRLEELLLRLADVEADENAERAALLRRAAKQSRDLFVLDRLNTASQSLRSQQFKNAIDSQNSAKEGLERMLTLLLSEDRPQRIRDEKERVGKMIQELKLVERLQKSTRARTENGMALEAISDEQQQIGDRAEKVRETLSEDADADFGDDSAATDPAAEDGAQAAQDTPAPSSEPGQRADGADDSGADAQTGEAKPGEPDAGEQQPGEQTAEQPSGEPEAGEQPSGEPQDGEARSGESAKPAEAQSQPDQPQDGEPSGAEPSGSGEPADGSAPLGSPS